MKLFLNLSSRWSRDSPQSLGEDPSAASMISFDNHALQINIAIEDGLPLGHSWISFFKHWCLVSIILSVLLDDHDDQLAHKL
jgi:hypothetical protein